jgi:adenine-specific DNA-methyltransferase
MFPDLFTNEGKINLDEVRKVFGQESTTERYEFNWYGKAKAKRDAFSPGKATLKFDSKKSVMPALPPM